MLVYYTSLYASWCTPPWYICLPSVPPWIHPRTYTAVLVYPDAGVAPTRAQLMRPWALAGRKAWVEASLSPLVLKSVNLGMPFRAELLRSSPENKVEDWM